MKTASDISIIVHTNHSHHRAITYLACSANASSATAAAAVHAGPPSAGHRHTNIVPLHMRAVRTTDRTRSDP